MDVLITRKEQKRISMRVKDEKTLVIFAPIGYPTEKIEDFIQSNTQWINKKVSEITRRKTDFSSIYSFDQTLINGKIIDILPSNEYKTSLTAEGLYISPRCYGNFEKRRKETIKFVKEYADENLRELISKIGTELGVCPAEITVRFVRGARIWGKCDANKRIVIDSRVIMLTPQLQRYVVLHEFAHLSVFNHSETFWNLVEKYVPNYKNCRNQLKSFSFIREIYT